MSTVSPLFQKFETDPVLEKEGIWHEYGLNSKNKMIRVRVARAGGANRAYQMRLDAKAKPHRRAIQNDRMDMPELEQMIKEVYIETVIVNWENMEDANCNDLPFTVSNVKAQMEALPDLYEDIKEQATKSALYRKDIQAASSGN